MMTFRQRLSTALALCVLNAAPLSGQAQQSELLPLPLDEVRMFTEALDRIRMAYVEEIDDKTLLENAIRGMLSGLDRIRPTWPDRNMTPFRKPLQVNSVGWA